MKVTVVGTGRVGLTTAVTMASLGHDVYGVDEDTEKIRRLTDGVAPFFEPGVQELLTEGLTGGRLHFGTDLKDAVPGSEVVFICVGTPARSSGEANLIAVERAGRDVAVHADCPVAVVEKSTVPAGTASRLYQVLMRERPELADLVEVVSNPEFLREGQAVKDTLDPDRILVGAHSEKAFRIMRKLYGPLLDKGCHLIETDIATAELAKHACNAFLALKISYSNALARMCELARADVTAVADVMGSDPRIGRDFLNAGLGYGGYCFPKDLLAFERQANSLGYDFRLLAEIRHINDEAVLAVLDKVRSVLWNLEDKRIALLGLSYKPNTDDVRFSPALKLGDLLAQRGADVVGYDPEAGPNAEAEAPYLHAYDDIWEALEGSHCAVICTEWDEFKDLDLDRARERMVYPIIVDGRNVFDPQEVESKGFTYLPTGRPSERRNL